MIKFNKRDKGFISFRSDCAYHLFAWHNSLRFYIARECNIGCLPKPYKWRTRLGPFEYEYTIFKFKELANAG